jgi:hypothetical protein
VISLLIGASVLFLAVVLAATIDPLPRPSREDMDDLSPTTDAATLSFGSPVGAIAREGQVALRATLDVCPGVAAEGQPGFPPAFTIARRMSSSHRKVLASSIDTLKRASSMARYTNAWDMLSVSSGTRHHVLEQCHCR